MKLAAKKSLAKKAAIKKPKLSVRHLSRERIKKPAQAVHARQMRSKMLRRSVVAKPAEIELKKEEPQIAKSQSPDKARLVKALKVTRSSRVKRFGNPVRTLRHKPLHNISPSPSGAEGGEVLQSNTDTVGAIKPLPSMVSSATHNRLERMLDEALVQADSHKGRHAKRKRHIHLFGKRRWLVTSLIVVLIGLIAGAFIAWRNLPQFSMGVASVHSHIKGSIPSYVPSGYQFDGPISYNAKSLSMDFKDSQGRYYTIVETPSTMSSGELAASEVPHSSQIQTSQIKGTTVYIYDAANNATWVNDGIKFTINDHAKLSSDEILKIADSL